MRNIRKIVIGFLMVMVVVICDASLAEGRESHKNNERFRRNADETPAKNSEEQTKKQTIAGRSQLSEQNSDIADMLSALTGILPPFTAGQQIPDRYGVKMFGFPPNAGSYIRPPLPNYAATFPYPGMQYPPQAMQTNLPGPPVGYAYGNPNGLGPIPNANNIIIQGGPQPQLPYANNFMSYGNYPAEPQGFPINPGFPGNPQYPAPNPPQGNIQIQTFGHRQSEYMNPFAGGFAYMAQQQEPVGYFSGYPRFQRSLKATKEE